MDSGNELGLWKKYQGRTANGKLRPLVVEALEQVTRRDSALDLGAGALNDTAYLLEQGFKEVCG